MKDQLLTIRDVMRILNVSRRTIYYWIKDGILNPSKIGGVYRFTHEDIDAVIQKNRVEDKTKKKKRILAIDDDFLVRESLKIFLQKAGWDVTVVETGKEAIALIQKEKFDLVMTDIRMPGMNGIETLKGIREQRNRIGQDPLPEIIFTAFDDENARSEAEKMGVREFALKPLNLNDFKALLNRNLN